MHKAPVLYLISGSSKFLQRLLPKLWSVGHTIASLEMPFSKIPPRRLGHYLRQQCEDLSQSGLTPAVYSHSRFGGATDAKHAFGFGSCICSDPPSAPPNVCRRIKHFLNAAAPDRFPTCMAPPPISDPPSRPIFLDGHLRQDGLFSAHDPQASIICKSVFAPGDKWVHRPATVDEILRLYDMPASYDAAIKAAFNLSRFIPFENAASPTIHTSVLRSLWGSLRGDTDDNAADATITATVPHDFAVLEDPLPAESLSLSPPVVDTPSQDPGRTADEADEATLPRSNSHERVSASLEPGQLGLLKYRDIML